MLTGVVGLVTLVASTRLPWARAEAACLSTDAVLGFGEGSTASPWSAVLLTGAAVAAAAPLLPPRWGRGVGLAAAVLVALAAVWGLGITVNQSFEAFRPQANGPAVGVLCRFVPAEGSWLGVAGAALLLVSRLPLASAANPTHPEP
ncbi:MAG TPA: hypothetical protein VG370_04315 [Chloroflexota bacterium]|jgi:hypothetical protein|nr:hypothetical protein [Chloroflexota bacterium]